MQESPALYSLSENAQIASGVLTAMTAVVLTPMSSASVYSQESWKTLSPCAPVDKVDQRPIANTISPSVQWSDGAEGDSDKGFTVKPSLLVRFAALPQLDAAFSEVEEHNDTENQSKPSVVSSSASDVIHESVGSPLDVCSSNPFDKKHTKIKLTNTKIDQQNPKRSLSSKAFRKITARLSFQSSKLKLAQLRRADSVTADSNSIPSQNVKLRKFRASFMRYSFIGQTNASPSVSWTSGVPSSMAPFDAPLEEDGGDMTGVRQRPVTMHLPVPSPIKEGSQALPGLLDSAHRRMSSVFSGPSKSTLSRPVSILRRFPLGI